MAVDILEDMVAMVTVRDSSSMGEDMVSTCPDLHCVISNIAKLPVALRGQVIKVLAGCHSRQKVKVLLF